MGFANGLVDCLCTGDVMGEAGNCWLGIPVVWDIID